MIQVVTLEHVIDEPGDLLAERPHDFGRRDARTQLRAGDAFRGFRRVQAKGRPLIDERLLGTWESDPQDPEGMRRFGKTQLVFERDGTLTYTIKKLFKRQVARLTWQVTDGCIVSNQPSQPAEERTPYTVIGDTLTLHYGPDVARYVRNCEGTENRV